MENRTNWSANYTYRAAAFYQPETMDQVKEIVARSSAIKVLGTGHSFNAIADTTGTHLSLTHFDRVIEIDTKKQTVTVESGIRYGVLAEYLNKAGFALRNMASLPHISVAGACATATHGSGDRNGNLATAVSALEMVTADGEVVSLSRDREDSFDGVVVGLGGIGVVTKLTLDIVPAFAMRQEVYENLPLRLLEANFDAIFSAAYSVSLFTDWQNHTFNQVWFKQRMEDGHLPVQPEQWGLTRATTERHPIAGVSAENCTPQQGIVGAWHERLPHFRMDFTPSRGDELQSEYFVPRRHACAALNALFGLTDQITPLLLVSEIRTVAADTLWLSPCYRRDSVALHFTWKRDETAVQQLLSLIESRLVPFAVRPHWGKLFTLSSDSLAEQYEKLPDFQALWRQYDPNGKFQNAYLKRMLPSK